MEEPDHDATQAAREITERIDALERRLGAAELKNTIFGLGWPQWLFVGLIIFLAVVFLEAFTDARNEALRNHAKHVAP